MDTGEACRNNKIYRGGMCQSGATNMASVLNGAGAYDEIYNLINNTMAC